MAINRGKQRRCQSSIFFKTSPWLIVSILTDILKMAFSLLSCVHLKLPWAVFPPNISDFMAGALAERDYSSQTHVIASNFRREWFTMSSIIIVTWPPFTCCRQHVWTFDVQRPGNASAWAPIFFNSSSTRSLNSEPGPITSMPWKTDKVTDHRIDSFTQSGYVWKVYALHSPGRKKWDCESDAGGRSSPLWVGLWCKEWHHRPDRQHLAVTVDTERDGQRPAG